MSATFFDSSITPFLLILTLFILQILIGSKKNLGTLNISIPLDIYDREEYEIDKDFSLQTSQRTLQGHYFLAIFNRKISQAIDSYQRNENSFQETTLQTTQDNMKPVLSSQKSAKLEKSEKLQAAKTPEKSKTTELSKSNKQSQKSKNLSSSSKKNNNNLNTSISSKARVAKQDVVSQAINKSIGNAAQMAEAFSNDNKEITECLYLNKLNHTDINIDEIANEARTHNVQKLSNEEIKEMVPSRKELDSYRETFDLSPEKLKARYREMEKSAENGKKKGQRSMSPGGAGGDLDYSIVKNELWKYSNDSKNTIEYLKLMVFALENKLKVRIF